MPAAHNQQRWTGAYLLSCVSAALCQLLVEERVEKVELRLSSTMRPAVGAAVLILNHLGVVIHDGVIDKLCGLKCAQVVASDLDTADLAVLGVGVLATLRTKHCLYCLQRRVWINGNGPAHEPEVGNCV
jgi:hypothetical protein